jgi:hypothetical protein
MKRKRFSVEQLRGRVVGSLVWLCRFEIGVQDVAAAVLAWDELLRKFDTPEVTAPSPDLRGMTEEGWLKQADRRPHLSRHTIKRIILK